MSKGLIVPIEIGLSGRFRFKRICAATGEVRQDTGWSPNMILNQGLNQIGNAATDYSTNGVAVGGGCVVGSGNTPPAATDTLLQSWVAGTSTRQAFTTIDNVSVAPYYRATVCTYRFGQGVAAGNLSEVGISTGVLHPADANWAGKATAPLFSRALIVDSFGVPTTITVLADEFLDVLWECRAYAPALATGSVSLDILGTPTSTTYNILPSNFTTSIGVPLWACMQTIQDGSSNPGFAFRSFFGTLPNSGAQLYDAVVSQGAISSDITTGITGVRTAYQGTGSSTSRAAYTNGNYYIDISYTMGLNTANTAGNSFSAVNIRINTWSFQMDLSPAIAKNSTRIFTFTVRVSFANRP